MKTIWATLAGVSLLVTSAFGQTPVVTVPVQEPPEVRAWSEPDPGDGSAHWDPDINYDVDRNWETLPDFEYIHRLHFDPGDADGYEDEGSGVTYYGLWIQEVTVLVMGECCCGAFSFYNYFTYYEYQWVTDQGPLTDDFGTGTWSTAAGQAEKGLIFKVGVTKFIPITSEEVEAWANDPDDKPKAVEVAEGFEDGSDGEWNTTAGDDGNIPVNDEDGNPEPAGPGDNDANSGSSPNSRDKPSGWDSDFDGTAQTTIRVLLIVWDYCDDYVSIDPDEIPEELSQQFDRAMRLPVQ